MAIIFSSEDVHPRDRFAFWHDVACKTIIPHASVPDDATQFHARLAAAQLDDIGMLDVEAAPMVVERNDQHISSNDHDDFLLCMQREGAVQFQGDNDIKLSAGMATLLDPMQAYVGRFEGSCRMTVARLPRRDLERRMGSASLLVLRDLDAAGNPDLRLASKILLTFMDEPVATASGCSSLREAILDLLAMGFSARLRQTARVSSTRERTLLAIHRAVTRNLSNPDLSIDDVATSAGLKVRYANALLEEQGTSLGRLILSMRLEKCAAALRDVRQSHRSIQDIAFAWGFSDQSYFGKRFKDAYGMAPRDYRQAAQSQTS